MAERETPKLTLLEQTKVQAQVLVPLLRAFRAELGEARANAIARKALYGWWLSIAQRGDFQPNAAPMQNLSAAFAAVTSAQGYAPETAAEIDIAPIRRDDSAWEFHVTGCRYAQFFRELGEPELGFMLLCNGDNAFTAAAGENIELLRPQTIMQGGEYCDFRWRTKEPVPRTKS